MLIFAFIIALSGVSSISQAGPSGYWGTAKTEDGKIAYTEYHTVEYQNGALKKSRTIYYAQDRKTKIATLFSDYAVSQNFPTYEFRDYRSGYREGVKRVDQAYLLFYQDPGEEEKTEKIVPQDNSFSGQGWHFYLSKNLEELNKRDIALDLVLPGRLSHYRFNLQKSKSKPNSIVVDFKIDNWFIGLFAPEIQLEYSKKDRVLLSYRGISNILDQEGEQQDVQITYKY